ncbi:MAG TPA: hypothetical protein VFI54_06310 [Solirubrobacteraceae bacterium]|nr:hypothetical protein [Solirubrobacteraceae bacterium]
MSALNNQTVALGAARLLGVLQERLQAIETLLQRQLDLAESPPLNFLGAGSTAYGSTTTDTQPHGLWRANPNRRGGSIQNIGTTGNLTVGLGSTTPTANTGITLGPGQSWDGRVSGIVWTGRVHIVSSASGVQWTAVEVLGPGNLRT